ncbi:hypothetical protein HaLaN_20336 [Haematococcus lacustris]|uniref:Uncharacterized protein n=1 Tax=Haematococcus lacustris TaxID=44745 RepID=A0A699ZSW0_HAELA|nr:hypothetical protein HaLaN_20336 [Haematococcus lacustris]
MARHVDQGQCPVEGTHWAAACPKPGSACTKQQSTGAATRMAGAATWRHSDHRETWPAFLRACLCAGAGQSSPCPCRKWAIVQHSTTPAATASQEPTVLADQVPAAAQLSSFLMALPPRARGTKLGRGPGALPAWHTPLLSLHRVPQALSHTLYLTVLHGRGLARQVRSWWGERTVDSALKASSQGVPACTCQCAGGCVAPAGVLPGPGGRRRCSLTLTTWWL